MSCFCVLLAYMGLSLAWDGLPRTLQFEISDWQSSSWGERTLTRGTVAVAGDGSRSNHCERQQFSYYFLPKGSAIDRSLYLRPSNTAYAIDDKTRIARGGPCPCTWEPMRLLAGDSECRRSAEARLPNSKRTGTGHIAGHAVIRYVAVDEKGTAAELSFAPALACEVMEQVHSSPGILGIPRARWRYRVTSYQPGEPDRKRFSLPVGYTIQGDH